ncbi:MAG: DUF4124 domain-containing protein [Candidatus Riflebacteria bacterium]|nr:DUF4124 domain-containing protein [Candidatus Riflebacteria bacterium]
MKTRIIRSPGYILILFLFLSFATIPLAAVEMSITYSVITGYGKAQELKPASSNETVVKSEDGQNAYRVKSVKIRDEAHLLQLMGGNESELTDLQRGLLETYRFSTQQKFTDLRPRVPSDNGSMNLELVDITGYEDKERYPKISQDFWPQRERTLSYDNGTYNTHSEIRISGANCIGYGPEAARLMQTTYAHEFGHALDLTSIELDGYGFDDAHYLNEKTGAKASFSEGFANFIKALFFPEEENSYRNSVQTVKIEKPEGGYDTYPIAGGQITGEDFLHIEAINALIFTRLASELPNGEKLVLDSFSKHQSNDNRMALFLKNFIKDYPEHASIAAQILDRETFGNLTNDQMRQIMGRSAAVDSYLNSRGGQSNSVSKPTNPTNTINPPVHKPGTIYKWKDENGDWHFTDSPPPNGEEYKTLKSPAATTSGNESDKAPDSNPFSVD